MSTKNILRGTLCARLTLLGLTVTYIFTLTLHRPWSLGDRRGGVIAFYQYKFFERPALCLRHYFQHLDHH